MLEDFGKLMQQAGQMKEKMEKIQQEAARKTVEATAGGGMVKVIINGKQQILSIVIEPEVLKDRDMLQDLVKAGVNEAIIKSQEMMAEEMKKLTEGFGPLGSMMGGQ